MSNVESIQKQQRDLDVLKNKFHVFREDINAEINSLSEKFKQVREIPTLQMELIVLRQRLVDQRSRITIQIIEINKSLNPEKEKILIDYKEKKDFKYSASDIKTIMESKLSKQLYVSEILTEWVMYCEESIKSVDSMLYGIKNVISVQEFLVGSIK